MEDLETRSRNPETLDHVDSETYVRIKRESAPDYRGFVYQTDEGTVVRPSKAKKRDKEISGIPIVKTVVRTTGETERRLEGYRLISYYVLEDPAKKKSGNVYAYRGGNLTPSRMGHSKKALSP